MKSLLKSALLLAFAVPAMAMANPKLVGKWETVSGSDRALTGVMELGADGSAKLGPNGFAPLIGTWTTGSTAESSAGTLTFEMPPHGSVDNTYVLSKGKLTLTYNDGSQQVFAPQKSQPSKAKPSTATKK
ncbi:MULTISPECIES: hypothetical protein [unclassified Variovorax]|uniref:hypothetical protein n=1 Tax=unclassified Variovorax TaxID=663243 RepID=UPI00076C80D4|nr:MULTISPECIES: hypothetical protein [unclassified Variovorax]KWT98366.1 hypothetical protein APY03_0501 [Variovorax sp. WDL1]PNG49975.1 hypothetical protein CHC06_05556 [Variovorax sp. B2]PNG50847.1 hypothetical protein CHC07_05461 [Variovorax sp. B4]VTU41727.1 hypothetical protein H6P1_00034 [Variovorax sp. PBL-H6]VTU44580.1 hypothetical protein SRS16P1_00868 [Variovorax sp. SRS16]